MEINIIAAIAGNGAIGRDNQLLWHISADMKYFRKTTVGSPVIMGYRTWLSIGRPLPKRQNIVITKSRFEAPEEVVQVADVEQAIAACGEAETCFIIGGAKTYERALDRADRLYITHVHTVISDADAFFPEIDVAVWKQVSCTETETDPENGLEYEFAVYERR